VPPLTLTILDPTSLLGREIADALAPAFPQAHWRFFHTGASQEHLIAEVAGDAALVPPLPDIDELSGSKAVLLTEPLAPALAARLLDWLREHPEIALVDATQPGVAPDEATVLAAGAAAPRTAHPWYQVVDPALAGPVALLAGLADLSPQSVQLTVLCPVSGYGADALAELAAQGAARLSGSVPKRPSLLPTVLAFDVAPFPTERTTALDGQLDALFPHVSHSLQGANLGVFHGHVGALHVEFSHQLRTDTVRSLLRRTDGLRLAKRNELVRPSDVAGSDEVVCSELRVEGSRLSAWVVADGLRAGAVKAAVEAVHVIMAS
jgi:hypothetical protein